MATTVCAGTCGNDLCEHGYCLTPGCEESARCFVCDGVMNEAVPVGIRWWTEETLWDGRRLWRHVIDVIDQGGHTFERRIFLNGTTAAAWADSWGGLPITYPYGPLHD